MRFKRVYIEISNLCNLNCSFCSKTNRPPCSLDEDQFRHIVREISPYTQYVYFHVKGEPLLHPLLATFLDICEENHLLVNLTTNGTLLAGKEEMLLSKSALRQVNFSLHSLRFGAPAAGEEPEFYNPLDLTGAENCLNTIIRFSKQAAARGKYAVLRLWNLDGKRQLPEDSRIALSMVEDAFPGVENLEEKILSNRSVTLTKGIFLSVDEEFVWPSIKNPYVSDTGTCYGTRSMVGILSDGTVVPCCLDAQGEAPLGNIFTESFSSIVESGYFKRIAGGFENRHVAHPLCRHCSYRTRFDKPSGPAEEESSPEE